MPNPRGACCTAAVVWRVVVTEIREEIENIITSDGNFRSLVRSPPYERANIARRLILRLISHRVVFTAARSLLGRISYTRDQTSAAGVFFDGVVQTYQRLVARFFVVLIHQYYGKIRKN